MMISITFSWISRHLHVYYHILINNICHGKGAGGGHKMLLGGTEGVLVSANNGAVADGILVSQTPDFW